MIWKSDRFELDFWNSSAVNAAILLQPTAGRSGCRQGNWWRREGALTHQYPHKLAALHQKTWSEKKNTGKRKDPKKRCGIPDSLANLLCWKHKGRESGWQADADHSPQFVRHAHILVSQTCSDANYLPIFFTFLSSQFCIHVYNTHASWTISSHSVLWIYRRFALLSKLRGQQPFNEMNGDFGGKIGTFLGTFFTAGWDRYILFLYLVLFILLYPCTCGFD